MSTPSSLLERPADVHAVTDANGPMAAHGVTRAGVTRAGVTGDTGDHGPVSLPCAGHAELFFADAPDDVERAKALCGGCPVQQDCLGGALARGEVAGVWGGELLVGGEVVARKRPRGRPRKHPVAV